MFELVMLLLFFGVVLWFLAPEEKGTAESRFVVPRGSTRPARGVSRAALPTPGERAQQWYDSGRR